MSFLADLQLAYENLADDPIDMGIHYGHSILNAFSSKLALPQYEPAMAAASAYEYRMPVTSRIIETPPTVPSSPVDSSINQADSSLASAASTAEPPSISDRLRSRASYVSRGYMPRTQSTYTSRALVGTI